MSMPSPTPAMPPPVLFAGLIDDAAVFPPGSHPIDVALARRFERSATTDARYVGSLLIPAAHVDRTLREVHPVPIVMIGRPGTPLDDALKAAREVTASGTHALAGIQVAHQDGWQRCLDLGVPVAIEVPADDFEQRLNDLVPQRFQTLAKLRTGSTPANPVPTPAQLAAFITACRDRELSFKLTGGMHHAITHDAGQERQFGFLNVLAAVDAALRADAPSAIAQLLDVESPEVIVDAVCALDDTHAHDVRTLFQSYGCCDVDDPINDLRTLGLIEEKK
ncbi:hypothetical protein [Yimella sp. cx-51]|uniref:hypothetical protein n=1 Tax=Yimella sp. cx-51 TaxID=2770551 RepID=UPI00165E3877|nr:hypothetical protein [Yimella sp. cx-51]MBC9956705.1 hypothetical protein [Yimella sp. cx-51]QTH38941.1 hypothetical protein J5M86_04740 [Yimella sp. cx-51]